MDEQTTPYLVSVVAPCFNEAPVLPEFLARITAVADSLPQYRFEILFVDDGSRDGSIELLRGFTEKDSRIRVISLSRNFGHQHAITAGLDHCQGDFVVVIDTDLQDPPERIPAILEALEAGNDVVHMVRCDRHVDSTAKRVSARLFYAFMRRFVMPELPEDAPDFKGFNERALTALRGYREQVRFLRGILASIGFRQTEILYTRDARYAGSSKYPLARVLRFAGDAIVSFSILPLRVSLFAGLLMWVGLIAYLAAFVTLWPFVGALASGATVLMITLVSVFLGLILVSLGIIGEYLGRLYSEAQGRPLYLIRELYNFSVEIPKKR